MLELTRISVRFVETDGDMPCSYRTKGSRPITVVPEQNERFWRQPSVDLEEGRVEAERRRSLRVDGHC